MFNQDELNKLEEVFVYVDLLSAIVAQMALYEQWRIDEEEDLAIERERQRIELKFASLEARLDAVENALRRIEMAFACRNDER